MTTTQEITSPLPAADARPAETADPVAIQASGPKGAPLVIVLHGWGSSAAIMRGFSARLEDAYRVVRVDLPGHGNAPQPVRAMGMEDHVELVSRILQDEAPQNGRAHFVGHSNGGRISLYMASRKPWSQLVRSMTLISPSGIPRPTSTSTRFKRGLASSLKAPFQILPGKAREAGLDWLRHSLVWRALGSSDYRKLQGPLRETFVQLVNTYVDRDLDQIETPTLLFWGDQDEAIIKPQIDALQAGIGDLGLVTLEGAGHYGFLDEPETVYAATRHFLDALEEDAE